jgi:peptidoglycan/xylan/chitin deacetylase (PgdA/CDA1 family)
MMRPSTLMYHDVVDGDPDAAGFPGAGPARYKLGWGAFRAHLDRIGRPPAVAAGLTGADSHPWLITFDDGGAAAPAIGEELTARGWRGHFFVTTERIGTPGFVTEQEVASLAAAGHVVGSHSCSHPPRMSRLSHARIVEEWTRSCAQLAELTGAPVRTASVPGGYASRDVARAADEAGIEFLFTSEPVRAIHRAGGCLVLGRFAVLTGTSAVAAAELAAGRAWPAARQRTGWELRKVAKTVGGARYERVRATMLSRRS